MASEIPPELQEDVLIEILARLPVKSLIRLTSACKYWLSLIKSHDFATKHYATRLGIQSHDHSEFDCFLTTFFPACSISTFRCENIETMSFQSAFKIRPAVPCEPPRLGISHRDVIRECAINGPCNGLFCLNLVKDHLVNLPVLLMWNPATREVFKPPVNTYQYGGAIVGLGYDHLNNDYRLLNFHGDGWGPGVPSIVSVYSLAANRWKQLDSGIHFQASVGVLREHSSFNAGKLHFPLSVKSYSTISLLSFDIVDEIFVQTSMPDDVATRRAYLGGFLFQGTKGHNPAIYSLDYKDRHHPVEIRIWVLNGYGPAGVWNEQRIALPSLIYAASERMLWKNTDIVIGYKMDGAITSYDFTTQQYHQMESPPIPGNERIIGYTESLVSIATCVRQPPSADHSAVEDHLSLLDSVPEGLVLDHLSLETGPEELQQDHSSVEIGLQGFIQDYLSLEFEQHGLHHHSSVQAQEQEQEQEQEDDDDGLSSTDSAFLMPERQDFWESDMEFDDFEINDYLHPYRLKECKRLSKLPT